VDQSPGRDFFISYTATDDAWAQWIAVELERAGYTTVVQAFDFRPGADFVHQMHQATESTGRTIAVLSPAYFGSQFAEPEWRVAFAKDPSGELGLLVPVRVQPCDPPGLFATRVYIDLVNVGEAEARKRLLTAVGPNGPRPTSAAFPGLLLDESSRENATFPGAVPAATNLPTPLEDAATRLRAQIEAAALPGLERFVLPVRQVPLLDPEGFLLPPSAGWPVSADEAQPQHVLDLVLDGSSFALLAAGGAGKSQTFSAMSTADPEALRIDVGPMRREDIERRLAGVWERRRTVYLDGLDQAAIRDPALLQWLEDQLTGPAADGISWRLACRSAAWEASLSNALRRRRTGFTEWKLLPLDRDTALQAVAHHFGGEIEAGAFVDALACARLGTLTACVGQLLATARYWRSNGRLPEGGVEAMIFEITEFVRETNPHRRPAQSLESKFGVAKRLGAMTTFAGEQVVSVAPGMAEALTVDQLPDDPEPSEPSARIDVETYREVLGTSLFDPGPAGTVTFRHQRYPEFLAAAYLVDRRVSEDQVTDLVGARKTGVIPASMIPVVAWLAALAPDSIRSIVVDNARALAAAAAAVELPDGRARAVVVGGLLDAAARNEAEPDWSIAPSTLVYNGLEAQLADYLSASPLTPQQMWWVARLAQAGSCHELGTELAAAAHDTRWFDYVRRAAVAAVGAVGDDVNRTSLADLLHPGADEDDDNEVLAAVIDALYPRLLTTTELLQALRPHGRSGLLGGYAVTLRQLADRIPDEDLPTVLAWLGSPDNDLDFDAGSNFAHLLEGILQRAWQRFHAPAVRRALAEALVSFVQYKPERLPINPRYPWTAGPREQRRALALDVIGAASTGANVRYVVYDLRVLNHEDADWLLDQTAISPPEIAPTIADCLPLLLHEPSAQLADRILGLPGTHPAATATAHLRGVVAIDDPAFAAERDRQARRQRFEQARAADVVRQETALRELLPQLDESPLRWWEAIRLLSDPDPLNRPDEVFGQDLSERRGWKSLTQKQQQDLLRAGLRYLEVHQPRVEDWWGLTQGVPLQLTGPDWFGVQLMTTLVRHNEPLLTGIAIETWQRWAAAIIATWTAALQPHDNLRTRLLQHLPPAARPDLLSAAIEYLDVINTTDARSYPHDIYRQLVLDLRAALVERLHAGRYRADLSEDLLDLIIDASPPDVAQGVVRHLCDNAAETVATLAMQRLAALDPIAAVDRLNGIAATPEHLTQALRRIDVGHLDDEHLATAATLLLDAYPYAEDPPDLRDFAISPQRDMRELTGGLLRQLADRGCTEALERLLQDRPDLDQQVIRHHLLQARRRRAELDHQPTAPRQLIDLLRRGDGRLVRSDADLLDVTLKQLDRLQHDIRHDGAFHELWNDPSGSSPSLKTEDDISDWIRRRLKDRLNDGMVIDREVQVARLHGHGIGTRIDLTLTAATAPSRPLARVLVEAKRSDNAELLTAMNDQLTERYLVPMGLRYGIFLVYWVRPDQRSTGWTHGQGPDMSNLMSQLTDQADVVLRTVGAEVAVYVLDVSRP
jgi:hypothetical protein